MNTYELMVLYFSDLKGETLKKEQTKLKDQLKSLGGVVASVDNLGIKELAYEMNKQNRANYMVVNFDIDPLKVAELNLWLTREDKAILRFLITKVNKKDTEKTKKK